MVRWEVQYAEYPSDELTTLLDDGWEPFDTYQVRGLSWVMLFIVVRKAKDG